MSVLRPGDEEIHYEDGSHRWASPDVRREDIWYARVAAHVQRHNETKADSPFVVRPRRRGEEDPRRGW